MQATSYAPTSTSMHAVRTALARQESEIITLGKVANPRREFAQAVAEGLTRRPRRLPSRFLYDARGSVLFDQITRQPEYYLTRLEASILAKSAGRIREIAGPVSLIELGSGSSEKTDYLLGAWRTRDAIINYIPVDVSETALRHASHTISSRHPTVRVLGLHTDYHEAFPLLKEASPAMVVFLGSSIGNFDVDETEAFLNELSESLAPGDFLLAGFDLVKDPAIIEAAYNDAAGVTEEFTRNLFVRMNRELGSSIDTRRIQHVARYVSEREQVETDARFTSSQQISIAALDSTFTIASGDTIRTEISRKFRLETLVPYLESFRFETREIFTDPCDWFAVILLQKT